MNPKAVGYSLVLMASLAACTPQFRNHGYVPSSSDLDALVIGVDQRDAVIESLGAPTTAGVIKDGNIYYVRSKFRQYGIIEQQEISREVVALTFDASGVLQNIGRYGLSDGQVVELDHRTTQSSVSDIGFIRRLIGSIGGPSASQFIK